MRTAAIIPTLSLTTCLAACSNPGVVVREQVVQSEDALVFPGPFAPKAMRIHPLTHAELDAQGSPRVVLHMELKDAWGDTVKGVGQVQARLWRDGQHAGGGGGADNATRWDIDLRALDDNAAFYDPATRTYRIVLAGLPAWLADAVRNDAPTPARLRVLFVTTEADATPVVLRDETTIQ